MNALTPTIGEVATVLETAADLYESEQVEWCEGNWAQLPSSHADPNTPVSVCAEGALLLAAGFTAAEVGRKGNRLFPESPLALRALSALECTINQGRNMDDFRNAHTWNDTIIGNRMPTRVIGREGLEVETLTAPNIPLAKSQVIEALKQTAKDLRNWEGSND